LGSAAVAGQAKGFKKQIEKGHGGLRSGLVHAMHELSRGNRAHVTYQGD